MAVRLTDKILPLNDGFVGMVDANQTIVDATGFINNLSGADTDLQHALNTLDGITLDNLDQIPIGTIGSSTWFHRLDENTVQLWVNGEVVYEWTVVPSVFTGQPYGLLLCLTQPT
jgi:hypothetical protein